MESLTYELARNQQATIVYNVNNKKINLLNINDVIKDAYYRVNIDASTYNIQDNYKNSDIKKLFYNHVIYGLCEILKVKHNSYKTLIYYNTHSIFDKEIGKDFIKSVNYIIKNLIKILPFVFISSNYTFYTFIQKIQQNDTECCILIEDSIKKALDFDISKITSKKLNSFIAKNDLTFLSNGYFKNNLYKLLF
jgi:hypothetical protein